MKVMCPDCYELVPIEECLPVLGFINCPECSIGSPALEWLRINAMPQPPQLQPVNPSSQR